jgi:hypothetical protein
LCIHVFHHSKNITWILYSIFTFALYKYIRHNWKLMLDRISYVVWNYNNIFLTFSATVEQSDLGLCRDNWTTSQLSVTSTWRLFFLINVAHRFQSVPCLTVLFFLVLPIVRFFCPFNPHMRRFMTPKSLYTP